MATAPPDEDRGPIGAWVLSCHPDVYDLAGLHQQGYRSVANWRVQPSAGTDRVRPGDRVVLWMEPCADGPAAGVWGVGVVTAPVQPAPTEPSPRFAWMDRTGPGRLGSVVDTDLRLLDAPIPPERLLTDPRFAGSPLAVGPGGSALPGLTPTQWSAVAELLPSGWADPASWSERDPTDLPDPGGEPLDVRFEPVTAAEVSAAAGVRADVVERVLVHQYEELEACYAAGDLIVTDLSYYCRDDDLLRRAEAVEASIGVDGDDAVDELVAALEQLAGDRLVLVPNDLPGTPGFLDGTGASEEAAERILDAYWNVVLERPDSLDPFWLTAGGRAGSS